MHPRFSSINQYASLFWWHFQFQFLSHTFNLLEFLATFGLFYYTLSQLYFPGAYGIIYVSMALTGCYWFPFVSCTRVAPLACTIWPSKVRTVLRSSLCHHLRIRHFLDSICTFWNSGIFCELLVLRFGTFVIYLRAQRLSHLDGGSFIC